MPLVEPSYDSRVLQKEKVKREISKQEKEGVECESRGEGK